MAKRNATIQDGMDIIEQQLNDAAALLNNDQRIAVEQPGSITSYRLQHPRGSLLIVPGKGNFQPKGNPGNVILDHNMFVDVYVVVNYLAGKEHPSFYVDFVMETLNGVEIDTKRSDRQLICYDWDVVKEERGEWWFVVSVMIPLVRYEKDYFK